MADDFSPLAQGIRLMLRMELDLPPEQFLEWLEAQPGAPFFYRTFLMGHTEEEPTEPEITPETTLIQAFPGLAKHYGKSLPQNMYRPNGAATYGL